MIGAAVIDQFLGPHPTKCQATYIWIDGTGEIIRSKTRTIDPIPLNINEYPIWNYDGSSCGQSHGLNSDLYLKPVAHYPDPFLGGRNCLLLCETLNHRNEPTKGNNRSKCKAIMDKIAAQEPWFGFEQEYLLLDKDSNPVGWSNGFPSTDNYCKADAPGEDVASEHFQICQKAGLKIKNFESGQLSGTWKYLIGPNLGISGAQEVIISRFLLFKAARRLGYSVLLKPKPTLGDWNGAGCHTNFSTAAMRAENGLAVIEAAKDKLAAKHTEHSMEGFFKTTVGKEFTWGIGDRGASVRIPHQVAAEKKGYLEDRRPSSNCDPYTVTAAIAGVMKDDNAALLDVAHITKRRRKMTEVLTVPKKRFSIRIDSTDVSFENLDFTAANHETSNAIYERDLPEDDLEEEHEEAGEEQEDRNEEEEEAEAEQEDRDEEEEKAEAEQEDRDEEEEKAEAEQEDRNEEAEGEERRQIHQKRTMSLNLYGKSHTTVLKVTNPQIRRK